MEIEEITDVKSDLLGRVREERLIWIEKASDRFFSEKTIFDQAQIWETPGMNYCKDVLSFLDQLATHKLRWKDEDLVLLTSGHPTFFLSEEEYFSQPIPDRMNDESSYDYFVTKLKHPLAVEIVTCVQSFVTQFKRNFFSSSSKSNIEFNQSNINQNISNSLDSNHISNGNGLINQETSSKVDEPQNEKEFIMGSGEKGKQMKEEIRELNIRVLSMMSECPLWSKESTNGLL